MARVPQRLALEDGDDRVLERLLASRTCERRTYEHALVLSLKAERARTDHAVACIANVSDRTVARVVARYHEGGLALALHDAPRSGRPRTVPDGDSLWAVALACSKPVEVGCATARELWYPSLFCDHVREVAAAQGHPRMSSASDQTILRVLEEARIQPFRLRYYCTRKDPEFDAKLAGLLAVYRELDECLGPDGRAVRLPVSADGRVVHVLSYDEKPGIQCIENVAPDLMPDPERAEGGRTMLASVCRDYEYRRRGTVSLLCAIDLLDGTAHHSVRRRHASADYVDFLGRLDDLYPEGHVIRIILDNHSVHTSRETQLYLNTVPGRFEFVFTPTHASWTNLVEGFFSTLTKQLLDGMRCSDRDEARDRIGRWFELHNSRVERPRHWTWGIDGESHDLDEVDVRDAVFHVVNGNACRPQDAGLRAAKPRTAAGSRPRRARRAEASGPGWEQLELPLVWDDPVTLEPGKEAA